MSDSNALSLVEQVFNRVYDITLDEQILEGMAKERQTTISMVRHEVITLATTKALEYTGGNVEKAIAAITIVSAQSNRLEHCAELLDRYEERTVALAYRLKDSSSFQSNVPFTWLCDMLRYTDEDEEGEASILKDLLEEIEQHAVSRDQEWFFHHRVSEMLERGLMLEHIRDRIMGELRREDWEA